MKKISFALACLALAGALAVTDFEKLNSATSNPNSGDAVMIHIEKPKGQGLSFATAAVDNG